MNLILDSGRLSVHRKRAISEASRDRIAAIVKQQTKDEVYISDWANSPANVQRQMGHPMASLDLERRLHKLNPALLFLPNPKNLSKMSIYVRYPGEIVRLGAYENGVMPEYSIHAVKSEETWDTSVDHLNRRDLPKHEWNPHLGEFEFDPTQPLLGFRRTDVPWSEVVRGWRTVLLIVMMEGIVPLYAIEQEFGISDRPQWRVHTGRGAATGFGI